MFDCIRSIVSKFKIIKAFIFIYKRFILRTLAAKIVFFLKYLKARLY